MTKWEYKKVVAVTEDVLDELGSDYWELVAIETDDIRTYYIFKRPIIEETVDKISDEKFKELWEEYLKLTGKDNKHLCTLDPLTPQQSKI